MKFYRYEITNYGYDIGVELKVFNLYKETPKGYWIGFGNPHGMQSYKRWISKDSRKRYAYPTKKEALLNFTKRTEKRIKILESQISLCKTGLKIARDEIQST